MLESTFSRTIESPKPTQYSPKHRPLLRRGVLETAGNPGLRDRYWDQRLVGGKRTQRPRYRLQHCGCGRAITDRDAAAHHFLGPQRVGPAGMRISTVYPRVTATAPGSG
jgi:hypothetical protein